MRGILNCFPQVWNMIIALLVVVLQPSAAPVPTDPESNPFITFDLYEGGDAKTATANHIARQSDPSDWEISDRASTGYQSGIVWLKLPPLEPGMIVQLNNPADRITLFEHVPQSGKWYVQRTGDTVPFSRRSMQVPEMALKLRAQLPENSERYLKIEQFSRVDYRVTVWNEADFLKTSELHRYLRLLIFGFCTAMILFNLMLSLLSRDPLFASNAITIACLVLLAGYLSGSLGYWLFPEAPQWNNRILLLSIGGAMMFGSFFTSAFLGRRSLPPHVMLLNKAYGISAVLIALVAAISLNPFLHGVLLCLAAGFFAIQLGLIFFSIRAGNPQAPLMLIPMTIILSGLTMVYMHSLSALDFGPIENHILEITLALEALAFSLILATRIRFIAAEAAAAQAELNRMEREAAQRFAMIQDRERSRLASDLHDSIGHSLAMASAHLEGLEGVSGLPEEAEDRAVHSKLAIRDAISETRRISHALHPARLDHLGLKKSLESMFSDLRKLHAIVTNVEINFDEELLSIDEKVQIHRIVQEAISNIIRHSQATDCRFQMQAQNAEIQIEICDNGVGLKGGDGDRGPDKLGLSSMEQRVIRLGGRLEKDPVQPHGLRLRFAFRPVGMKDAP